MIRKMLFPLILCGWVGLVGQSMAVVTLSVTNTFKEPIVLNFRGFTPNIVSIPLAFGERYSDSFVFWISDLSVTYKGNLIPGCPIGKRGDTRIMVLRSAWSADEPVCQ